MGDNGSTPAQPDPDLPKAPKLDPERLKDAHERTGRLLREAGLPFEDDELDDTASDADGAASDTRRDS